jgi:UDP-glucose 4-epimerase
MGARATPAGDPPFLGADVHRLFDEVGWRPKRDLGHGLGDTIAWWRRQLAGGTAE